jgi:hypothetical protein
MDSCTELQRSFGDEYLLRSSTVWPGLAADSKASVTAERIRLWNNVLID